MPIPDADKLRAELEAAGEKEVRKKLAAGVYGSWKVGTIKEWLREKEESRAALEVEEAKSYTRSTLSWAKIGVIAAIVSAAAAVVTIWLSK